MNIELEEIECGCGHQWSGHKRTSNGAFACAHFGCGCRDMVYPLHAAQPDAYCGPLGYHCEDVASSELQELGTLLIQDYEIDNTGVGHAEPDHTDRSATDYSSIGGG